MYFFEIEIAFFSIVYILFSINKKETEVSFIKISIMIKIFRLVDR